MSILINAAVIIKTTITKNMASNSRMSSRLPTRLVQGGDRTGEKLLYCCAKCHEQSGMGKCQGEKFGPDNILIKLVVHT